MSWEGTAADAAQRVGSGFGRLRKAWAVLPHERRLAAYAAVGLFVTLFLPWYQVTVIAPGKANLQSASVSVTGWGAFSFVEGAVLLVAGGVLALLFQRAEGRAFHLPGGDGWVITVAGLWTCALVIWRIFDKQGTSSHNQFASTSGIEWGIFIALAVAAFLAYAGSRIRAAHSPEPPLPGEGAPAGVPSPSGSPADQPVRRRRAPAPAVGERAAPGTARGHDPAPTEPLPRHDAPTAPQPGRADDQRRTDPLPRLADLPRFEPEEPPTLRIASRRTRAPEPRRREPTPSPDDPAPDEQLTIPLEERQPPD